MVLLLVDRLCCYYIQCVVNLLVLLLEEALYCRLNRHVVICFEGFTPQKARNLRFDRHKSSCLSFLRCKKLSFEVKLGLKFDVSI